MVSTYVKDTWTEAMVKLIRERYPDEDKETIEKYVLEQFEVMNRLWPIHPWVKP